MSFLHTPLCDDLGIEYPIVLAGMGMRGRATPPALVAAVSNAGGLGVLGFSGLDADEIRCRIHATRDLTDRPFGVDILLPANLADAVPDRDEMRARIRRDHPQHAEFVDRLRERFGLPAAEVEGGVLSPEFVRRQVDVIIEERVPVIAVGLGDPAWLVPLARQIGAKTMGLVGNVRNARRQVDAGVDYVIAQGTEAGGHTGRIATVPLMPQVVDAVKPVPVLAAGGIADGRGLVAALALGAVGVWCGTAFLVASESEIFSEHQRQVLEGAADDFVVTRAYTGKTARDYRNEIIVLWESSRLEPLPMPLQGVLMDDFSAAAETAARHDLINNPAGQIGGLLTSRRPAMEIVRSMVAEAGEVVAGLQRFRVAAASGQAVEGEPFRS